MTTAKAAHQVVAPAPLRSNPTGSERSLSQSDRRTGMLISNSSTCLVQNMSRSRNWGPSLRRRGSAIVRRLFVTTRYEAKARGIEVTTARLPNRLRRKHSRDRIHAVRWCVRVFVNDARRLCGVWNEIGRPFATGGTSAHHARKEERCMAYWIASLALIVFGFLGQFSIGQPFFLVGVAMLMLGRFRGRPLIYWPPLLAVVAYNVVYWAVAPFGCSASSGAGGTSATDCWSLIGIHWTGAGIFNPSLLSAMVAGLVGAGVTGLLTFAVLIWQRRAAGE